MHPSISLDDSTLPNFPPEHSQRLPANPFPQMLIARPTPTNPTPTNTPIRESLLTTPPLLLLPTITNPLPLTIAHITILLNLNLLLRLLCAASLGFGLLLSRFGGFGGTSFVGGGGGVGCGSGCFTLLAGGGIGGGGGFGGFGGGLGGFGGGVGGVGGGLGGGVFGDAVAGVAEEFVELLAGGGGGRGG